jgi:hypothetical protein
MLQFALPTEKIRPTKAEEARLVAPAGPVCGLGYVALMLQFALPTEKIRPTKAEEARLVAPAGPVCGLGYRRITGARC